MLNSAKWYGVEIHPEMKQRLLHPGYDPEGLISAFNVITEKGLTSYKAFVEFVAERYTRPDARYGRACGYIIGNEVNSQWVLCNVGEKTVQEYEKEYSIAVRTAFYAARKKYSQARVYVSLDHLWTKIVWLYADSRGNHQVSPHSAKTCRRKLSKLRKPKARLMIPRMARLMPLTKPCVTRSSK